MRERDFSCGVNAAVDVVGGRWKPSILWVLSEGPRRTGELRRELEGISEKVLVQQLRELERDGTVRRTVHAEVPPRVVYSLTEAGAALELALRPLGEWGDEHRGRIIAARRA
ncbi:helix-turn-helix domain-containing protein [Kineococcus sp. NUM-3379]